MLDSTSIQHLYNDNLFLANIFRINPDKIENVNSTANCGFSTIDDDDDDYDDDHDDNDDDAEDDNNDDDAADDDEDDDNDDDAEDDDDDANENMKDILTIPKT